MKKQSIYISESTTKSLWQKYEIFEDEIVFHTLLGDLSVPFDKITSVKSSEASYKGLFTGSLKLKDLFVPTLKIDWSDFTEHITIDRNEGVLKRISFTPENLNEFMDILNKQLDEYKKNHI